MAKIKFIGNWCKSFQDITHEYLTIKVHKEYKKKLWQQLQKLEHIQNKHDRLKDLEFVMDVHYKKRTLDQNRLMWALYKILANVLSGGAIGENKVSPEQLYDDDLKQHSYVIELKAPTKNIGAVRNYYKRILEVKPIDDKYSYIRALLTSSNFDTVQMTKWIDMLFNRLAELGVNIEDSGKIANYWMEWRQYLNDQNIAIFDEITNTDVYKRKVIMCEACGKYLQTTEGEVHHIRTVGSGGIDIGWNYLRLCSEDHIKVMHQKGWNEFISLYPHTKNKINKALVEGVVNYFDQNVNNICDKFKGEVVS
jgi:hypothetical protein